MELRTLRYFLAVAQAKTISAAAEALHVTQPTLSRQMQELEEELGIQVQKGVLTRAFRRSFYSETIQQGKPFIDREINEIFLLRMDDLTTVTLQKEEVSEVVWMPIDTVTARLDRGDRELCLDKEEFREVAKAIKAQLETIAPPPSQ